MRIIQGSVDVVGVSERTNWVHVSVQDSEGRTGVGEGTLDAHESQVVAAAHTLLGRLANREFDSIPAVVAHFGLEGAPGGLAHAAAVSAIEQALWDILGQRLGVPVYELFGWLGGDLTIPLYANINRALLADRSPEAFAAVATAACAEGFEAVKCAPFDDVIRAEPEEPETLAQIRAGLRRVEAVRNAIGDDAQLAIDCHYRFTARSAMILVKELEHFNLAWIEAPVAEHRLEEWKAVRQATSLRIAGGEMMTGLASFRRFIDTSGVDIVMPDVKYVGGISGLREVAALAKSRGISVAPHNPSGPVATLATAHTIATFDKFFMLEYAYGECAWRSKLVQGAEDVVNGHLQVARHTGLGTRLDPDTISANRARSVQPLDVRLYG